ncbi:MAG TPA: hypothetical protein VNI82_00260 [Candidatus Nitrosotenuis sp.]|nr:hypothetical protein [Candidatus Nitrosotenuis sp.]
MNVFIAAATGRYTEIGNAAEADCVIGQSFGAAEHGSGYVNELIAKYIVENTTGIPMLLQNEIAAALPEGSREPALVIEGNPSTSSGGGLDSWEVLNQTRKYMAEHGLSRPLLVTQASHAGRVTLQAKKQRIAGLIVPKGLPREFDPDSVQSWTRSQKEWAMREVPGILYLKFVSHKL